MQPVILYHRITGFPPDLVLPTGKFLFFKYSHHAITAAKDDRYGEFKLLRPLIVDFRQVDIFEIGLLDETIVKVGFRMAYDDTYDISHIVSMTDKSVITVWLNEKGDNHQTLDFSRYQKP